MKTFEVVLSEIETAGFKLNNLFQRTDGLWLGNVRSVDSMIFEYAIGDTATEVMSLALENAFKRFPVKRPRGFIYHPGEKVPNWETYQPSTTEDALLGPIHSDPSTRERPGATGASDEVADLLG